MDLELDLIRVVPTQGRDYKNREKALADWGDNRDFEIVWGRHSGRVINKQEADKLGITVQIRYWRQTRLTKHIHPVTEDPGLRMRNNHTEDNDDSCTFSRIG